MTDAEIIKAMICCTNFPVCDRDNCPYGESTSCATMLGKDVVNLINRQKAEIERFKKIETAVNGFWDEIPKLAMVKNKKYPTLEELLEYIENLKNEAIKEFAERLRTEMWQDWNECSETIYCVDMKDVDNLVKEMVGDSK